MDTQQLIEFAGNHTLLVLALFAILVMLAGSEIQQRLSQVKAVSPGEATRLLNHENAIMIDMRSDKCHPEQIPRTPGDCLLPAGTAINSGLQQAQQAGVCVSLSPARRCAGLAKSGTATDQSQLTRISNQESNHGRQATGSPSE
jgi:hypothetical protein